MHRPEGVIDICKFFDRVDNATPDGGVLVIADGREFAGRPGAFGLGLDSVPFHHQVRDAPAVDLAYHAGQARRGFA